MVASEESEEDILHITTSACLENKFRCRVLFLLSSVDNVKWAARLKGITTIFKGTKAPARVSVVSTVRYWGTELIRDTSAWSGQRHVSDQDQTSAWSGQRHVSDQDQSKEAVYHWTLSGLSQNLTSRPFRVCACKIQ